MNDDDDNKDTPFQMRVNRSFLTRVDDWRRKQPLIPSRSEAIRVLVDFAIKHWKKG